MVKRALITSPNISAATRMNRIPMPTVMVRGVYSELPTSRLAAGDHPGHREKEEAQDGAKLAVVSLRELECVPDRGGERPGGDEDVRGHRPLA